MQEIRFDDVAALTQRVGEEFCAWSSELTISQALIDQFAELTGDRQWIHIDVERAQRESPFGGTIAHGFLLLSLIPVLRRRTDLAIVDYANAVNYGADKLRFISPVPAGSQVHGRSRIVAVEGKAKGTMVTEEIQIAVVGAAQPALTYSMLVMYQGSKG